VGPGDGKLVLLSPQENSSARVSSFGPKCIEKRFSFRKRKRESRREAEKGVGKICSSVLGTVFPSNRRTHATFFLYPSAFRDSVDSLGFYSPSICRRLYRSKSKVAATIARQVLATRMEELDPD